MPEPVTHKPQVLSYAEAATERDQIGWELAGGVLTLIVPPQAQWRLLFTSGLGLLVATVLVGAIVALFWMALEDHQTSAGSFLILLVLAAGFGAVWTRALRQVVRIARGVKLPAFVRVSAEAFEVAAPDPLGMGRFRSAPGEVADLRGYVVGTAPAVLTYLLLQVVQRNGQVVGIRIPWPHDEAVAPVIERLRDALGLPYEAP
jgi:hypothetical protein